MQWKALNAIWFLLIGWVFALPLWLLGAALCCTILMIPLGRPVFRFGSACAAPFGKGE